MADDLVLSDLPQPEYDDAMDPDALGVDGDNPNEMTDEQFGLLCDRMADNGWLGGPVITDTDGLIADGEHRWRAAQEIGLAEVPVRQYDIDDATRRLWRQELNKIHGEHDAKRDALEYDHLLSEGFTEEVNALAEAAGEDLDELLAELRMDGSRPAGYDYDPEHNVYFEDCVEGMRERLADDSVDCVITDPPYGVDADVAGTSMSGDPEYVRGDVLSDGDADEALELWEATCAELSRVTTDTAHLYVFAGWRTYHEFARILKRYGFNVRGCLVWVKKDASHNRQFIIQGPSFANKHEFVLFATAEDATEQFDEYPTDVLEYAEVRFAEDQQYHPTQKPFDLLSHFVELSTDPSDTVLDPFMGSGTTAVAAIQNDRDYVGFEIDEENYREVIERRIGEAKRQREASVNQEAEADD